VRHVSMFKMAAVTATLLLGSIVSAPVASAATTAEPVGQYCAAEAQRVGSTAPVAAPVCFTSYAKQVSFLTHGKVTLASNATFAQASQATQDQIVTAAAASGTYYLSQEYSASRFRDSLQTFYASTDCLNGSYYVSTMPSGWNNVIGSSKALSSCWAIHYDQTGATNTYSPPGATITCYSTTDCAQLGAMNDATSSMQWF
jgi:hypothetical protein